MSHTNEIRKQLYRIARKRNIAYDLTLLNYMQNIPKNRVELDPESLRWIQNRVVI